jgi:FkbM family methyltransferase
MDKQPQLRDRFIKLLAKRRNYQQEIKKLVRQYEYVVFYGCGAILNSIVETWDIYVGRKIDYCCDSDSKKWGKYFCGAKCISPQELITIKDKCVVFITVGDFEPVFKFLTASKFPSVNQIYKYDLIASDFLEHSDYRDIADNLCQTYEFLSDEQSKKVFDAIVNRVLGHEKDIDIMVNVNEKNQYFPKDIIKLSEHESFVDIGAYNGDTIEDFIGLTQEKFDNIFSFEVSKINFNSLEDNVKHMSNQNRIRIFNLGIWDSECDITFSIGNSQSTIGEGEGTGHVVVLDDVLEKEKVTFIKMDIEGAEPRALRGASNIIKSQKPKLAICIYHDFKHLWEIPHYLKELVPEYKIYLRHHTKLEYETVCYAVI